MSSQSCTPSFLWERQDLLGRGATSEVFRGLDRTTGDQYAVKVFKFSEIYRNPMFTREVDLLKTLDHENIVKFVALENVVDTPDRAIIMELCPMGSLFDVLQEPENYFGLGEQEFILLLDNIVSAMEYLDRKEVVHRDIKPANILKTTTPDGRKSFYKFSDFGTARKLRSREKFNTVVGTEEYVHPDMLAQMLNDSTLAFAPSRFKRTVDLWSTGATLYHAASGRQPFQPYGGRDGEGTRVLFEMTSTKEFGVISGVQLKPGGDVIYSRHLPSTCRLSKGLQQFLTPIIAGTEERDDRKMWTFERFFRETRGLLDKLVVQVFDAAQWQLLNVYLDKTQTLEELRHSITSQTSLPEEEQILLWEYELLDETDRLDYVTSHEEPVLLLPTYVTESPTPGLPRCVNPPGMDYWSEDKEFVSMAYCAAACVINRLLETHGRNVVLADKTMRMFSSMFHSKHETALKRRLNLQGLHQSLLAIGRLLQQAVGPLPPIQQRLDAVKNLLKAMELPGGLPEWMTEPSSSVQEELEYTIVTPRSAKNTPRITVNQDHSPLRGSGALGMPARIVPKLEKDSGPPSSSSDDERTMVDSRSRQQRMSKYAQQQKMHSTPHGVRDTNDDSSNTLTPSSAKHSASVELDKPVTPIIARRRRPGHVGHDGRRAVATGRKSLHRRTFMYEEPREQDEQKKHDWLQKQEEAETEEKADVVTVLPTSPKPVDQAEGVRGRRISSSASELGETIEVKYTLTSIPRSKVLKELPPDISMPHQARWLERSLCVVEDIKKVNETVLRDFTFVDRRSAEYNELHYKRTRTNLETLFSSIRNLIEECMSKAVLPMFQHLQEWLIEMEPCLAYARDMSSSATPAAYRSTGRLDQAQQCCDIIIRELQHTIGGKLASDKLKRQDLAESLQIILDGLNEET